ncbi:MAG: FAD-dependent oxidoreductase [Clostridiaceae bacterium]|nr:FAD-dependent oxidoreductase [Clostridiaceae bacterium]
MDHYDVAVVGSGAGLTVLETALEKGRKCAIIENAKFGGTCLNRGCIPSKILVYPADLIRENEKARQTGLNWQLESFDWATITRRVWHYIDYNKVLETSLAQVKNLTVYRGTASFTGSCTLQVPDEKNGLTEPFQADLIVLAPGSRPHVPPVAGLENAGYLTSASFFSDRFPARPWKSLIILGGGSIGLEFAHIFSAFGTKVTLVEMMPHLAPTEEEVVSRHLETNLVRQGIEVITNHQAVGAGRNDGGKSLTVRSLESGETRTLYGEELFVASGVQSNADLLQAGKAGIAVDARGYILTNEYLETNRRNIWALGDVNGKYPFRHKANQEAEVCLHNMFRPDLSKQAMNYQHVPWAIFTSPQIAHVGLREQEARERGIKYQVGVNYYSSIAMGYAMGYRKGDPDDGFVKLLVDENMKIIGVHIIGPHAAILIQSFVYLMNAGYRCHRQSFDRPAHDEERARQIPGLFPLWPETGSLDPITRSMVIHPSLNELTAWVIDKLAWPE